MASHKTSIHNRKKEKGFTLIEIIIVVSIFILITGVALTTNFDSFNSSLTNEQEKIVTYLYTARSESMNNVCLGDDCTESKEHGIHFETHSYTLFQGDTYSESDIQNEYVKLNPQYSMSGPSDIIFATSSGNAHATPENTWNVVLSNGTTQRTITIGSEGDIHYSK